jgi:glycine/D-amino acid oxidase-like deaminating enzyme
VVVGAGIVGCATAAAAARASFRLPEEAPVLFQPDTGDIAADRALVALARAATAAGEALREGARATRVADGLVASEAETSTGAAVVATAGPWARSPRGSRHRPAHDGDS